MHQLNDKFFFNTCYKYFLSWEFSNKSKAHCWKKTAGIMMKLYGTLKTREWKRQDVTVSIAAGFESWI